MDLLNRSSDPVPTIHSPLPSTAELAGLFLYLRLVVQDRVYIILRGVGWTAGLPRIEIHITGLDFRGPLRWRQLAFNPVDYD